MLRKLTAAVVVIVATGIVVAGPSSATTAEYYGQYARMFARSAGQVWSGGQAASQWAWEPVSSTESHISWGDPANWPPQYRERFVRNGSWVYLDGWWDNGTYYTLRVSRERIGDSSCANLKDLTSWGGKQHYVKWTVPTTKYRLIANGTIIEKSSGKVVNFRHVQKWSPPGSCSNAYYRDKRCIAQYEAWWDDNGSPGTIKHKLTRTVKLAKGIGMGFTIRQTHPSTWSADLRRHWTW